MTKDEKERVMLEKQVKKWRRRLSLTNTVLKRWEGRLKRHDRKRQMMMVCVGPESVENRGRKFRFDE